MRKKQIQFIAEIGIFAAFGLVLDLVAGLYSEAIWPNGGSMTLAFVPIFIMGYKYGLKGGLITGTVVGIIQLIWSKWLINVPQVLLDYVLPNVVLGLVGIVSSKVNSENKTSNIIYISISIIGVCIFRLICLTLSGVLYWETGLLASIIYNGTFTGISCGLSLIVTILLMNLLPKEYLINNQ